MSEYYGKRTELGCAVCGPHGPIDPRLDLFRHSPTGFEWGYGGSGPAQLALAILYDVLRDENLAVKYHQQFKQEVIAKLPQDEFKLTQQDVLQWFRIASAVH